MSSAWGSAAVAPPPPPAVHPGNGHAAAAAHLHAAAGGTKARFGEGLTVEQLHAQATAAITALYNSGDDAERRSSDEWLRQFSRHSAAWSYADGILALGPFNPGEVAPAEAAASRNAAKLQEQGQFMASQILLTKLRHDHQELSPETFVELREKLLLHLQAFSSGPGTRATRSRLALCLAAVALHSGWESVVTDIATRFADWHESPGSFACLPAALQALPEECYDREGAAMHAPRDAVTAFERALTAHAADVLRMLMQMLQAPVVDAATPNAVSTVQVELLACIKAWVRDCRVPAEVVVDPELGLLSGAFAALHLEPLFDSCVDLAVEVVRAFDEDADGSAPVHAADGTVATAHDTVAAVVLPSVVSFEAKYLAAVEEGDDEAARGFCRLFTACGESYVSLILSEIPPEVGTHKLVELLVRCTDHADPELAAIPLPFWWKLAEGFRNMPSEHADLKASKQEALAPFLTYLVSTCTRLARFPDEWDTLTADAQDDFLHKLRYDVADVLIDCCTFVSPHTALEAMRPALEASAASLLPRLEGPHADPAALAHDVASADGSWQMVEAALFAVRSIARSVPDEETSVVPPSLGLANQLLALPSPYRLRGTCLRLLGRFAEWMDVESNSPHLGQSFATVVAVLSDPALRNPDDPGAPSVLEAAAAALRSLCKYCSRRVGEEAMTALEVAQTLPRPHVLVVVEAMCHALSSLKPDPCVEHVMSLAKHIYDGLSAFAEDPAKAAEGALAFRVSTGAVTAAAAGAAGAVESVAIEVMVEALDKLTVIVRYTSPRVHDGEEHPAVRLVTAMWPLLDKVSAAFEMQTRVIEKVTRLHKYALQTCRRHYRPLVPDLLRQLEDRFAARPHSGYIYAAGFCIAQFHRDHELVGPLMHTLEVLSRAVFGLLAGDTAGNIAEHPDIVEDYFRMAGRGFENCPDAVLSLSICGTMLQFAAAAIGVEHREFNRTALIFIESFFRAGVSTAEVAVPATRAAGIMALVTAHGMELATALVAALTGGLKPFTIDDPDGSLSGAMLAFALFAPEQFQACVDAAIVAGVPAGVVPDEGRAAFFADLAAAGRDERKFARALWMMSDTVRRAAHW